MQNFKKQWLGNIQGHVSEAASLFKSAAKQRAQAQAQSESTILTDAMLRRGLNAGQVLHTTLHGKSMEITASDLAVFRRNMALAKRQSGFAGQGITARQVIDLAASNPLQYLRSAPDGARSDIDRARREITMALPVSALNDKIRFMTNAGPDNQAQRHHVVVQLLGFKAAHDDIVAAGGDPAALRKVADKLRKGMLKFDCDCGRHRYFLRYVATIGGFNAGADETGFPKIRNTGLRGVACKHVLRVMSELESSGIVLKFLEKHLDRAIAYKARSQVRQDEAEAALANKKSTTRIKTSEQRQIQARKAQERRAALKSASGAPMPSRIFPGTKKLHEAIAMGKTSASDIAVMRSYGLDDRKILELVERRK